MANKIWNLNPNQINDTFEYAPEFVLNKQNSSTVAHVIKNELKDCVEFYFSVAFITKEGLLNLQTVLAEIYEEYGVKGKIITADFLNFNKPEMFEHLLLIENIESKCSRDKNFHPKGYIFKKKDGTYTVIIGSANLTDEGMVKNTEWNLKLNFDKNSKLFKQIISEFEDQWNHGAIINDDWIQTYRKVFNEEKSQHVLIEQQDEKKRLSPNAMQEEALKNLKELRNNGKIKALLISATGTGKTFLSAFDVQQFGARKMLFVVHREKILKDAKRTFEYIFGNTRTYGFLTGNKKEFYEDFIFASSDTLGKDEILKKFSKYQFDYVIIDEAHHSVASRHEKIIEYFKPQFLLGMTATPIRMDNEDIYKYFDHNIAYEITLEKALNQDLLCPFRYFGISDKYLPEGSSLKNKVSNFEDLWNDKRVDFIMQKAKYYSPWNNHPQGLIFVSKEKEAIELSKKLNQKGWRTIALTGNSKDYEREQAIHKLENKELDYLITINIFNEGVDIKFINQIIMLRETESITVFVQQLGRGLRKYSNLEGNKDYVVILDFIGNYNNNFMIPMALTGDQSYNKENLRRKMVELEFYSSNSYIEFDKISQSRILESINKKTTSNLSKDFNDSWKILKGLLSRTPTHADFAKYQTIDLKIIKGVGSFKNKSYVDFLIAKQEIANDTFNEIELRYIRMIFKEFITSKFTYLTDTLIQIANGTFIKIEKVEYLPQFQVKYYHSGESKEYLNILDSTNKINPIFQKSLENNEFKKQIIDMCTYNKLSYQKEFKSNELFKINQLYTRKDYSSIIGCSRDEKSTIYGYKLFKESNFENNPRLPIFVTYKKPEDVSFSLNYADTFFDKSTFIWESKSGVTKNSKSIQDIIKCLEKGMKPELFVKKSDDEDSFYYLGKVDFNLDNIQDVIEQENDQKVKKVKFELKLHEPVKELIYNYITDWN